MTPAGTPAPPCPSPRTILQFGSERRVRCGRRGCCSCGVLWLTDTRIRVLAAVQAHASAVALVTVTAPGVDVLPWGPCGTLVDERAAAAWNRDAPTNWSYLHRAAAPDAREVAAGWGMTWRLLVKAWEYQRRGVLHLHLLVPAGSPAMLAASNRYVAALHENAHAHGFGFVDRGKLPSTGPRRSARTLQPVDPHRAAAYVSAYVASTGAGKGGVAEVAAKQGVPGAVVYVAQALTARSGVTMRSLRARRRVACRFPDAARDADTWHAACVLDELQRGRPPLTSDARASLLAVALAQGWTHTVDTLDGSVRGATSAPAPGQPARDQRRIPRATVVGHVRLDSVLHRGPRGTPEWVSTAAQYSARPTFEAHRRGPSPMQRCTAAA